MRAIDPVNARNMNIQYEIWFVKNYYTLTLKRSIFDKKMVNPKFKAIYKQVSTELNIGEQIAQLRHKAKMSQLELTKKVHTSRIAV